MDIKLNIPKQTFINEKADAFSEIIAESFISANIPLYKLRNPLMISLFNRLGHPLPSDSGCRKVVDNIYERKKKLIRNIFLKKPYILIIDEAQYLNKRYINIQLSLLEEPFKLYLVYCRIVVKINSETIGNIFYN